MPVKRTKAKARSHRVTQEAVQAFRTAEELREVYDACNRGSTCRSTAPNRHCDECRAYIEANQALDRLLGLKPWEVSPLDVAQERCSRPYDDSSPWVASFPQAQALRAELLNWERD